VKDFVVRKEKGHRSLESSQASSGRHSDKLSMKVKALDQLGGVDCEQRCETLPHFYITK
jgi:hypothetical protein